MAAAPHSSDFDDRAEVLRARLRDARAEADRYEADPTSDAAMARAIDIFHVIAVHLDPAGIDVGVADDGTIDITWNTARREIYLEIGPGDARTQSIETDLRANAAKAFGDHLQLSDVEALLRIRTDDVRLGHSR
jgi:hypothetical protein